MPNSQKGFAPILIVIVIVVIVSILGGVYFLNGNYKKPESKSPISDNQLNDLKNTVANNPSFEQSSPSPLPKDILDKITVVPLNASKFEKTIVEEDGCNNPVGLVVYSDKSTNSAMKINSLSLKQNNDIETDKKDLVNFLNQGKKSDFQNITTLEEAFREYCGGAAHMLVRELPGVKYSGVDKVRTLMDMTTQSPVAGIIVVTVYAQKGDNVIQLSKSLGDDSLYKAHEGKCAAMLDSDSNAAEQCYKQEILNDTKLQSMAQTEANNLITRFAIK